MKNLFESIFVFMLSIVCGLIVNIVFEGLVNGPGNSCANLDFENYSFGGKIIFCIYWLFIISGACMLFSKQYTNNKAS
jgi:hypothetical protein